LFEYHLEFIFKSDKIKAFLSNGMSFSSIDKPVIIFASPINIYLLGEFPLAKLYFGLVA
jgi:hypothetical protein